MLVGFAVDVWLDRVVGEPLAAALGFVVGLIVLGVLSDLRRE